MILVIILPDEDKPKIIPPAYEDVAQPTPQPTPEQINLSGIGQQVSKKFTLESGLSIFRMTHNGRSHFGIWLLDKNGNRIELLVNRVGAFDGSKAVRIPNDGIYLLDISADGNWSITIE